MNKKQILAALVAIIAIAIFYYILQMKIPGTWQFVLVVVEMLAVNQIWIRYYKQSSEMGLILLRSDKGLEAIDSIARTKENLATTLVDIGNSIGYGMLSQFIFQKRASFRNFIIGLALLAFLSLLVAPTAFLFLFQVLKLGAVDKTVSMTGSVSQDTGLIIVSAILAIGGLFLFILAGIVYYGGFVVLPALANLILHGSDTITKTASGGTFLLPGINLPLFEGIIALAIVMVVHEGGHAVLSRIAKIRVLSSGLVLFGVIPIGAFVEPDEKEMVKVEAYKQTRVLIAGPAANFITSSITFILFMALVYIMNNFDLTANPALPAIKFIYVTLGLTFALNFIVGAVNLLPVPMFDGYRIMDVNVKNKTLVKIISYGTLMFFILNFLPSLFR
ncbi:MAG: site-2 protease family protein [Candidatus Bilamarchaeum sp.]